MLLKKCFLCFVVAQLCFSSLLCSPFSSSHSFQAAQWSICISLCFRLSCLFFPLRRLNSSILLPPCNLFQFFLHFLCFVFSDIFSRTSSVVLFFSVLWEIELAGVFACVWASACSVLPQAFSAFSGPIHTHTHTYTYARGQKTAAVALPSAPPFRFHSVCACVPPGLPSRTPWTHYFLACVVIAKIDSRLHTPADPWVEIQPANRKQTSKQKGILALIQLQTFFVFHTRAHTGTYRDTRKKT